jgi:hypothetical protein
MTQLNSKSIKSILQEALSKDGDFLKGDSKYYHARDNGRGKRRTDRCSPL